MPAQVLQQQLQLLNPADKPDGAALDASLQLQQQAAASAGQAEQEQEQQQQQQQAGATAGAPLLAGSCSGGGPGTTNILPYGSTLHYPGCSCPAAWQAGSRVADQVDRLVAKAHGLYQQGLIAPQRKLRVCYMLPHHNITGGMKCLVEHIRLLKARGHYTIAVHRSDTATRAMPPWTSIKADADVVCNLHQRLSDVYPVNSIDVVLVGIFHQVAELLAGVPAPVVYWEQGHEWLFGDPVRLQVAQNYLKQDQLFHTILHLPVVLAAVSSAVQDILQQEFGRSSLLIPNGIDCERFQPGPFEPQDGSSSGSGVGEDGGCAAAAAAAADATGLDAAAAAAAGSQQDVRSAAAAEAPEGPAEAEPLDAAAAGAEADADDEPHTSATSLDMLAAAAAAAAAAAEAGAEAAPMDITPPAAAAAADGSDSLAAATAQQEQQQGDALVLASPQNPSSSSVLNPSRSPRVQKKRVLLVGNPALPLKGFPTAIAALTAVSAVLPIKIRWVCQVVPSAAMIPGLQGSRLDLETVVSPNQGQLPGLYRGHDVFLFTSRYEAWGMPVLEAMATGLPVVTTDCLGVRTFCRHGDNCLMGLPDDVAGLAQHLLLVLTEPALAAKLSAASRQTALQYTPERVTEQLEAVLYCLTAIGPDLLNLRRSCLPDLQAACQKASEACSRPSAAQQQQLQRQRQLALQQLLTHSRQQQVAAAALQQYQLQSLQVLEQLDPSAPQHVVQLQQMQQQLQHQQQQDAAPPLQLSGLMPFLLQQQQQQQQQQSALLAFLQASSRDAQQVPAASILQQQQQQLLSATPLFSQQLSQHLQLPTSLLMLQQQQQQQQQQLQFSQQQQAPSSLLMQTPTSLLMLQQQGQQQQQQMLPQFQQASHQQLQQLGPRLQVPVLATDQQQRMLVVTSQHVAPSPVQTPASLQLVLHHLHGQQQQQQQDRLRLQQLAAQSQQPLQHQQLLLSLQPHSQQQQLSLQPSLLTPPQQQQYLQQQQQYLQQQQQQQQQGQQLQQLFTLFS